MANQRHLAKLKEGVGSWNEWRLANPSIHPDLSGADLTRFELVGANLANSNLSNSNLRSLSLAKSNFSDAILAGANLTGTILRQADFTGADLTRTHFDRAEFSATLLTGTCLLGAKGLSRAVYLLKSQIDHKALEQSGRLPEILLLGCGFSESDLHAYRRRLADPDRESYHTCFLSHSGRDSELARAIYRGLTARGVDCFFDEEDVHVGNNLVKTILPEIEKRDRLIVLITSAVTDRAWVEKEISWALRIAIDRRNQDMILPVLVEGALSGVNSWWVELVTNDIKHITLADPKVQVQIDQTVEDLLCALRKP